eukprot:109916-Amphidinium_carterae.1
MPNHATQETEAATTTTLVKLSNLAVITSDLANCKVGEAYHALVLSCSIWRWIWQTLESKPKVPSMPQALASCEFG